VPSLLHLEILIEHFNILIQVSLPNKLLLKTKDNLLLTTMQKWKKMTQVKKELVLDKWEDLKLYSKSPIIPTSSN
jgi:hypothetical protein